MKEIVFSKNYHISWLSNTYKQSYRLIMLSVGNIYAYMHEAYVYIRVYVHVTTINENRWHEFGNISRG